MRAFSLIEMVFVLFIISVLGGLAAYYLTPVASHTQKSELNTTLSAIIATLAVERQKCLLSQNECEKVDLKLLLNAAHADTSRWSASQNEIRLNTPQTKASFIIQNGILYCASGACEAFSGVKAIR